MKPRVSKGKSFARNKFQDFYTSRDSRRLAIDSIKSKLSYPDLCEAIDYLNKNLRNANKDGIWGNPLPKNYSELGEIQDFSSHNDNPIGEINFVLLGVRKYKNELSQFLSDKQKYEKELLLGNYANAKKILDSIDENICVSLWSLENRFLLSELNDNSQQNKKLLSDFTEINNSQFLTKSIAHYLSVRAEKTLSVKRFTEDLELAFSGLRKSKSIASYKDYYKFKLSFQHYLTFDYYGSILAFDFQHSVIDRYISLIQVFSSVLINFRHLDLDDSTGRIFISYLKNRVDYLIRKTGDPFLYKLKLMATGHLFPAFNILESEREIEAIDFYTIGDYKKASHEFKTLLLDKPNQFDLYVLYVKSLIFQKKEFKAIGNSNSLQNQILKDIYSIIALKSNPKTVGNNLLRIASNLSSISLSYGIVDFVLSESQVEKERSTLAKLSYNIANPIVYKAFKASEVQLNFLQLLKEKFPHSITLDLFLSRFEDISTIENFEDVIPKDKYWFEYALRLQNQNDFLKASKKWEFLISTSEVKSPIYQEAIIHLFNCYKELKLPNDCVKLYVKSFFENNYLVNKINALDVVTDIGKNKFQTVSKNIDLPIFYTIVESDDVEAHIALELFLLHNGIEKPSELLSDKFQFDSQKLNFLLQNSCIPKILMHSTFIENSKSRLEERLALCNYLKSRNVNKSEILAEIKAIENILVIQQGKIDLDESKIYVNESGIIEHELKEYEPIFDRFNIYKQITTENDQTKVYVIKPGHLSTYEDDDSSLSGDPLLDLYIEIFNAIKHKFLHSQFGIVAYLSTRIRHGVLVGEIRPIFEKHKLITLTEGKFSNYRRNFHWDLVYENISEAELNQLQILLKDFSAKIDGVIFDLIKRYLQVYHPNENPEGWFNYEYGKTEHILNLVTVSTSISYENFVDQIFTLLWNRTDENLAIIRDHIENRILNSFNDAFESLEIQITELLSFRKAHLMTSITNCSTEIQTVIQKISRWFIRSEVKASDFKIEELVNIILDYTNNSSPMKKLALSQECSFDKLIKGIYKTHFADLLRIFFENIKEHSELNIERIPCSIKICEKKDSTLEIVIRNEISSELAKSKKEWSIVDDQRKLLVEGNSGLVKASKILSSDLNCLNEDYIQIQTIEEEEEFCVLLKIKNPQILK
jgi:hypothetical protein